MSPRPQLTIRFTISVLCILSGVLFPQSAWAQPVISGFTPASGPVGTTVTISGSGFDNTAAGNIVYFGAVKATVTAASSNSLTVTVPNGATYEPVTVTSNGLTGYSNRPFHLTFPGAITAFGPTSFSQNIDFNTTASTIDAAINDLNGDNKPDVLVINGDNGNTWVDVFVNGSNGAKLAFQMKTFSATVSANSIALGDFDGDGRTDVALDGAGSGIAILKNNSSGGNVSLNRVVFMQWPYTYAVRILVRDFDGDGKPDLAALNTDSNSISFYKNTTTNGTISFAAKVDMPTGPNPQDFCSGDIDNDGKPDIVVSNAGNNTVTVFRNTNTGTGFSFTDRTDLAAGQLPHGVAVGDFDGDNKVDIAVTHAGFFTIANTVSILKNTSTTVVSFAAPFDLAAGKNPQYITVNDLDGDGKLDLAVNHVQDTVVSVFKNTSNGTISFSRTNYVAQHNYPHLISGDLDGDNYPDLALVGYGEPFTIYKNQVTVNPDKFTPPVITSFSPGSGVVGSTVTITGTGFSAVAANNVVYFGAVRATVTAASATSLSVIVPPQTTPQPISVTRDLLTAYAASPFLVTYAGSNAPFNSNLFEPRIDSTIAGIPQGYCVSDLDGDGKPDLVLAKSGLNYNPGPLTIYRNTGSAGTMSFAPKTEIPLSTNATGVLAADMNGDGKPDLVAFNYTTQIFINTSTPGHLSFRGPYQARPYYTGPVVPADFDNDGRTDLVIANNIGGITICKNLTVNDSVFFYTYDYNVGNDIVGMLAADLSADGKPEIVLLNRFGKSVSVLKNYCTPGNIKFVLESTLPTGNNPYGIAAGDLDRDGKTDLAVVDYFDSTLSIYRNSAAPGYVGFYPRVIYKTGYNTNAVTINDLNGDGKPDISVINYYDSTVGVYKNNSTVGTISFDAGATYKTPSNPVAIGVADWDGDGLYDLGVSNINMPGDNNMFSFFRSQLMRPVITSFTPAVLSPGVTITINGFNFTNVSQVKLGGAAVRSFTVVSASQIAAVVGEGAEGEVSVTTPVGTAVLGSVSFVPPVITSFTPTSGAAGASVTIIGTNFSAVPASNHVYFGAVQAVVTAASTTSLTVEVPVGAAAYQPISVSTFNKIAWAAKPFQYTFAGIGNSFNSASFDNKVEFYAGIKPKGICTGDLDGDGLADVVLANDSNNYGGITVLRNNGSAGKISFEAAVQIPLVLEITNICMADINADGKQDLVVLDHQNGFFNVLINTSTSGVISFAKPVVLSSVSDAVDVAAADLDQDGRTDLVITADWPDSYSILRNTSANGVISFSPALGLPAGGGNITGIALADINGDSKPELIMSYDISSFVRIFNNTSTVGTISFNLGALLNVAWPYGAVTGDIDGDGKSDLVIRSKPLAGAPTINVYKNTSANGAISFASGISLPGGFGNNVALGDLDGDNKLDIATGGDSVAVYKNASTPGIMTFLPRVAYKANRNPRICLTDIDADGKSDIVTAHIDGYGDSTGLAVLRNRVGEAKVVPSGANPVTGAVGNKVTADATVQTLNGNVYVQRHYDIKPANDPATATATVTLYFTQQEFDNFNAAPNHGPDLPKNANDATGKANVRVYQYHGFSTTSLPGTYTGQGKEIDPDDANIVWNAAMQWWEITFDVNGFSGFFISTAGFNYNQVPAPVITARSATSFCVGGNVVLVANIGLNNQWYKDGVAINGANTVVYQTGISGTYTVTATNNGVTSPPSAGQVVLASAVPAQPVISQNGPELLSSAANGNQWYLEGALIAGATGQSYKPTATGNYSVITTTGGCASVESARYSFISTGIIDLANDNYISLTPNPVTDKAWLKFKLDGITTLTVQMVNMQGQLCGIRRTLSNGQALDVASLPTGIYFVQVISTAGRLNYTLKLIKL